MRPDLNHFSRPPRTPRPPAVGDIARQLRELPSEAFPPYDFAEFVRRGRERSEPRRQWVTWPHAAAAAGLTAVVAALALLGTSGRPGANDDVGPAASGPSTAAVSPGNASEMTGASAAGDPLQQALAAREWLARQPAEPALARAGSRLTVAGLEDRIAWFDDALTDQRLHGATPAQLKVLQQERARLVSSLAQVRYAEALVANGS